MEDYGKSLRTAFLFFLSLGGVLMALGKGVWAVLVPDARIQSAVLDGGRQ